MVEVTDKPLKSLVMHSTAPLGLPLSFITPNRRPTLGWPIVNDGNQIVDRKENLVCCLAFICSLHTLYLISIPEYPGWTVNNK